MQPTPLPPSTPSPVRASSPKSVASGASGKRTPERDEPADGEPKRRRVSRACDVCRRRKIRCDGPTSGTGAHAGDGKCSHCRDNHLACTYVNEPSRKAARPGLIAALAERCLRLEELVQQLSPGFDPEDIVGPPIDPDSYDDETYRDELRVRAIPPLPEFKAIGAGSGLGHTPLAAVATSPATTTLSQPRRASSTTHVALWANTVGPGGGADPFEHVFEHDVPQFYGRAAAHNLVHAVNNTNGDVGFAKELQQVRRPLMWAVPPWQVATANSGGAGPVDRMVWPDDDQAALLFDAYFANVNNLFPLLHPQRFRALYFQQRLYLASNSFARVCLGVFANGARYAPTAHFSYWHHSADPASAGWKYVAAIRGGKALGGDRPSLFNLQTATLLGLFLRGNAEPNTVWLVTGAALRSAQVLGVHARLPPAATHAEMQDRELLVRAFWCLYHLDRNASATLGRSAALPDAVISAATCDGDEPFLDHTAARPSPEIETFNHVVSLDRIISSALETIPSGAADTALPASLRKDAPGPQQATIIGIVALLNSWIRSLPAHLQWGDHVASLPDDALLRLAHLHARYHWAVIYVHYGGVAAGEWTPELSLDPSVQSAKSLFAICELLLHRKMFVAGAAGAASIARPLPVEFADYAWLAGAITLVAISTSALPATEYDSAMAGVQTCIATLVRMEAVSRRSGQSADLLSVMARNVAAQAKGPVSYVPQLHPQPQAILDAIPRAESASSLTDSRAYSFTTQSIASMSVHTPSPAPPLLSPTHTPPDPFPWLVSPQQYVDLHSPRQAGQGQPRPPPTAGIYYTDIAAAAAATAGAGTGAVAGGLPLSVSIPADPSSAFITRAAPVGALSQSTSPVEPLPTVRGMHPAHGFDHSHAHPHHAHPYPHVLPHVHPHPQHNPHAPPHQPHTAHPQHPHLPLQSPLAGALVPHHL